VQHLPHSVKIWITAANLEHETKMKKRVLRKGAALHAIICLLFIKILQPWNIFPILFFYGSTLYRWRHRQKTLAFFYGEQWSFFHIPLNCG